MASDYAEHLIAVAEALGRGDFGRRARVDEQSELAPLAAGLNRMVERASAALEEAIRDRERIEAQNFELQRLDRLKDSFLATTSHELRTPINGIHNLLGVILDGHDGALNEAQQKHVQMAYDSAANLKALVNKILDVSKVQADLEVEPTSFDLGDVVEAIIPQIQGLLTHKEVDFYVEMSEELGEVYADKLRVQQVVMNLIGNAAKFTHQGRIELHAEPWDESRVEISVLDTGIGIPEDEQPKVFDAFVQAERDTDRSHEGAGLGLSVVRRLVELHGGEVWLSSELGQGSTFSVTLPRSREAFEALRARRRDAGARQAYSLRRDQARAGGSAPAGEQAGPGGGGAGDNARATTTGDAAPSDAREQKAARALLILGPGHPGARKLTRELASAGFELDVLRDPASDLSIEISQRAPEVVVVDYGPDVEGSRRCLAALGDDAIGREIPALAVLPSGCPRDALVTLPANVADYLFDPIEPAELAVRIDVAITRHRPRALATQTPASEPVFPVIRRDDRTVSFDGGGAEILCVDDNPINLEVLDAQLSAAQYRVQLADSGAEALKKVRTKPPDVVLSDVMMPEMDGFEFVEQLRRTHDDLPIIFVTARDLDEDRLYGLGLGAVDYITKPVEKPLLLAKLKSVLERRDADRSLGRLQAEIEASAVIQKNFLPAGSKRFDGLDVEGVVRPARHVSGDWYGVWHLESQRTVVINVADVMGKGVPASMLTGMISSLFEVIDHLLVDLLEPGRHDAVVEKLREVLPPDSLARVERLLTLPWSPQHFLNLLNDLFWSFGHELWSTFMTLVVDLDTGRLHVSSAGGPPPLICRAATKQVEHLAMTGTLVGAEREVEVGTTEIALDPGDTVVLCSDGIIETTEPRRRREYGFARLRRLLMRRGTLPLTELQDAIFADVERYGAGAEPGDDRTLVLLRRTMPGETDEAPEPNDARAQEDAG